LEAKNPMMTLTVNSEIFLLDGAQSNPRGLERLRLLFLMCFKFISSGFME
jgi:hypothetical protein